MADSFPVGAHWDSYRNDEKGVSANEKDPPQRLCSFM